MKAAVLPLIGKSEDMAGRARKLYEQLRQVISVEYDDGGQIGRRYRRQDEIGTPYALTIDDQTLEDDTITIRERDSLAQERISIGACPRAPARPARRAVELAEARFLSSRRDAAPRSAAVATTAARVPSRVCAGWGSCSVLRFRSPRPTSSSRRRPDRSPGPTTSARSHGSFSRSPSSPG